MTDDIRRRVYEHKHNLIEGFTKQYGVHNLVYYEETNSVETAITREKQLKHWNRAWKVELVEKANPGWRDMSQDGQL